MPLGPKLCRLSVGWSWPAYHREEQEALCIGWNNNIRNTGRNISDGLVGAMVRRHADPVDVASIEFQRHSLHPQLFEPRAA